MSPRSVPVVRRLAPPAMPAGSWRLVALIVLSGLAQTTRLSAQDLAAPVVVAPAPIVVQARFEVGSRPQDSSTLAGFLGAATASDNIDPFPQRLLAQVQGHDVRPDMMFPIGTTTVTFRYRDSAGNIGQASSTVTVNAAAPSGLMPVVPGFVQDASSDGRYVVVVTDDGLAPADGALSCPNAFNQHRDHDVYLVDRVARTLEWITVGWRECVLATAQISQDGRYVAVWTLSANAVPGDTNNARDVFVRDRQLGTTRRVTLFANGAQFPSVPDFGPENVDDGWQLSASGQQVLITTRLPVTPDDTNGLLDVYVYDLPTSAVRRRSLLPGGGQSAQPALSSAVLSADGRYVFFDVDGSAGPASLALHVHDGVTGITTALGSNRIPRSVTADGRRLAFTSISDGAFSEVPYVLDLDTGQVDPIRAQPEPPDRPGSSGSRYSVRRVSDDATVVLFQTGADVVPAFNPPIGAGSQSPQPYVYERATRTARRLHWTDAGTLPQVQEPAAAMSRDGRVAFITMIGSTVGGANFVTFAREAPAIESMTPANGPTSGGTRVTLTGRGFYPLSTVTVGGVAATQVAITPTSISFLTPSNVPGSAVVQVLGPDASWKTMAPVPFVYGLTTSSLAPVRGPAGGGTYVVIRGSGFAAGSGVTFGGTPAASVAVIDPTTIVAVTPARPAGPSAVIVTGPGSFTAGSFEFRAAPQLTGVTPAAGPAEGGQAVVLSGTGFDAEARVYFGVVQVAATTTSQAGTQITLTTPPLAPNGHTVTVENADGQRSSLPSAYQANKCQVGVGTAGIGPDGGRYTGFVRVTTPTCAWTVGPDQPWVAMEGQTSGIGDGEVTIVVQPNPDGKARFFRIGDSQLVQSGRSCSYALSPGSIVLGIGVDTKPIDLMAVNADPSDGACQWRATSDAAWLSTSGLMFPFLRMMTVPQANAGPNARLAHVQAETARMVVAQEGTCAATVTPAIAAVGAAGGTVSIALQTGCAWSVTPDAPWMTVSSAPSGTGNATVQIAVQPNTAPETRETVVLIGSRAVRIGQSGTADCVSLLSEATMQVPAAGGSRSVDVTAAPGCSWPVTDTSSWATPSPGGTGNGVVTVTAAAHVLPGERYTTFRVGPHVLDVTQLAPSACVTVVWPAGRGVPSTGGTFTVQVEAPPTCQWSVITPSWVTASPISGSASGSVTLTVAPDTSPYESSRSASVFISGRGVSVIQNGPPAPWWSRSLSAGDWGAGVPLVSHDGRVAVAGGGRTIVDPVTGANTVVDILAFDTSTGVGVPLGLPNSGIYGPFPRSLSADGRFLAFGAASTDGLYLMDLTTRAWAPLLPPDGSTPVFMDGTGSIFVARNGSSSSGSITIWNRTTNQIVASLPYAYVAGGEQRIRGAMAISGDGSTVLLAVKAGVNVRPLQRWHWQTGQLEDVPVPAGANLNIDCVSGSVSISGRLNGDGTRVLFAALASCEGEYQSLVHVYMFNATTGTTALVTRRPDGQPSSVGVAPSNYSIDASGRYVAFASTAGDLTGELLPIPSAQRLYRYDAATGVTERVRVRELEGTPATVNAPAVAPGYAGMQISGDGQHFAAPSSLLTRGHPIAALQLTSITPTTAFLQTDTTVTVTGGGFVPGLRLMIDGQDATNISVQGPTSLTARFPGSLIFAARVVDVRATTPNGASAELLGAFRFAGCDDNVWTLTPQAPFTVVNNTVTLASTQGGQIPFTVTTASPCRWTLEPEAGATWLTVSNGSGQGTGSTSFTVGALPAGVSSRSAGVVLKVGGTGFRGVFIQQLPTPPCAYTVTPTQVDAPFTGATVPVAVQTTAGCAWTVQNLPAWITASPMSGAGPGTVTIVVAPSVNVIRSASISIGGRSVNVSTGFGSCTYTMTPSEVQVPAEGGTGSFRVTATPEVCGTTLSTSQPWATLSNATGTGSWMVNYTIAPNPTTTLRWAALTSTPPRPLPVYFYQAGRDCVDSVTPLVIKAPASGGVFDVEVTTLPGVCNWSGQVTGGFIVFKGSLSGSGGRFSMEVQPNSGAARKGSVRIGYQVFHTITVCQAAPGAEEPECETPAANTRYFAEGATSVFFDTRLAILNPGDADTTASITFARGGGSPVVKQLPVPARRRVTLDPKTIPDMAAAEFSTRIESDQPLVIDRTMSWDVRNGFGAHAEASIVAPALTWYLAEGSTVGSFNLFYLLQNPNAELSQVRVRYLRPSGAPLEKTYTLQPSSRTNIWVNVEEFGALGRALEHSDVSAVLEVINNQPIIVERAMYLNVPGQLFGAGHESAGVTTPATEWFLAEGATGPFFDLFALVANPTVTDARIEATYLLPDGTVLTRPYTVAANSRFNIWVDLEDPLLADTAVSTIIRSVDGVPIIVERAMWWPGGGWYEAHNSPGTTTTGTKWALAEGEVGGPRGVATYILLANTSPADGQVKVTLLFEDGSTTERIFPVTAKSRFNVDAGHEFPQAANRRFGAIVESVGETPVQLVVERAMYWDALGQTWAAGTNALATKLR